MHAVALMVLLAMPGSVLTPDGIGAAVWRLTAQQADSVNAREILKKAVTAAGGAEAFEKLHRFRIRAQSRIFQPQTTIEFEFTEISELPDKTKHILALAAGRRVQVMTGNTGWKAIGGRISSLTSAEVREMQRGLRKSTFYLFKNAENPDYRVEFLGEESSDAGRYWVLQIKDITGDFVNLYVNVQTYLIARKSYQGASEAGLATLVESYSDYREVGGIMMPFRTEVRANGKKFIESEVLEAEINPPLKEDFFNIE